MPAPFAIPKDMKMMKVKAKALKFKYLYSAQHISWTRRITHPMLQWPGYASQHRNHMFGSMQKGQLQEVTCRVTQVLESRGLNPPTCRLLLLTSYCTIKVSTGGTNSFPYTGKLKNPHKVVILTWDSFAKLYVEAGLEDFVPTLYWNEGGKRNNWFRWFWTQWKRILLYKQNLEAFALNSSVLKYLTWNLAGMQGVCVSDVSVQIRSPQG